jgi:hypothetical protein
MNFGGPVPHFQTNLNHSIAFLKKHYHSIVPQNCYLNVALLFSIKMKPFVYIYIYLSIYIRYTYLRILLISHHIVPGWWFQPLWKILVSWDYYSPYMEKSSKPPTRDIGKKCIFCVKLFPNMFFIHSNHMSLHCFPFGGS